MKAHRENTPPPTDVVSDYEVNRAIGNAINEAGIPEQGDPLAVDVTIFGKEGKDDTEYRVSPERAAISARAQLLLEQTGRQANEYVENGETLEERAKPYFETLAELATRYEVLRGLGENATRADVAAAIPSWREDYKKMLENATPDSSRVPGDITLAETLLLDGGVDSRMQIQALIDSLYISGRMEESNALKLQLDQAMASLKDPQPSEAQL